MKILVDTKIGIGCFGLTNAFNNINHEAKMLSPDQPVFDAFSEFEPDVFVSLSSCLQNSSIKKNLDKRDALKAVLYAHPLDLSGFDTVIYPSGSFKEELACDILHVGDFYPWKLDLISLFIKEGFNVKIFSFTKWPIIEHLGKLQPTELVNAYKSCKLCLDLESMSGESFYRSVGAGAKCISNCLYPMIEHKNFLPIQFNNDPSNIISNAKKIIESLSETQLKEQQDYVINNHTYIKVAEKILEQIND